MNGLRAILQTNNTTSPVNGSAYGSSDLIRDTLQAARQNGGEPDLLVVSTNFMSGFATWGQAIQRSAGRSRRFLARRSTCSRHRSCTA